MLASSRYHIYVNENIDVSMEDVTERIKENQIIQAKLNAKYQYALSINACEASHDKNINDLNDEELNNLYNGIIEKLKEDNDKVMVKKYE